MYKMALFTVLLWLGKITTGVSITAVLACLTLFYGFPHRFLELTFALQRLKVGMKLKYVKCGKAVFCYAEKNLFRDDKPSLLFLHGFTASTTQWIVMFKHLRTDQHLLALDMPGHGRSSTPNAEELSVDFLSNTMCDFLDAIGMKNKKVHVIGTSLGGAVAGIFAAKHPDRVEKVTLICPGMSTPVETDFTLQLKAMLEMHPDDISPRHCSLLPQDVASAREMFEACCYFKEKMKFHDQIFKGLINLRIPKNDFFISMLKVMNTEENLNLLANCAPSITMPSQIIWGKHDEIISSSGAEYLKSLLPDCRHMQIIEECGHCVDLDRPRTLCKALTAFMQEDVKKEK